MPTLAEQRAAIRAGITANMDSGKSAAAARRAIGEDMVKRRTGRDEVDDINAVIKQRRQRSALPTLEARGGVPAQTGTGNYTAPPATAAGLASPVTEPSFAAREYWPTGLVSSDGLFFFPAPKKIVMQDANGAEAVFEYAEPVVPSP